MAGPQKSELTYDDEEEHSYPTTSKYNADRDKKRPSSTAYRALDDSYDPTNVGKSRAYTDNSDSTYYSDKHASRARALSYSDDIGVLNHHSQGQTIDESPVAPLVRGVSNKQNEQYQDLGVFQ
jgi:hypothetical protein